jgi:hypothetical protein
MAVSQTRRLEIQRLTRQRVGEELEGDLNGGESIMKEVWEQCDSRAEVAIAKDELRRILTLLDL